MAVRIWAKLSEFSMNYKILCKICVFSSPSVTTICHCAEKKFRRDVQLIATVRWYHWSSRRQTNVQNYPWNRDKFSDFSLRLPRSVETLQFQHTSWPCAVVRSGSSWVEMSRSRSLADKKTARQARLSSRCCRCRQTVSRRTGWESTSAQLNLSTQNHVQYVRPAAGGNARSPRQYDTRRLLYLQIPQTASAH